MPQPAMPRSGFDRTNAIVAAAVFLLTAIVYALTVQRTFSYWDCGEFIACAYILGIPHPPGTPLFVLLGRVISLIPFVEDVAYRINYISVLSSALTAMFSYLLTVRLVGYFFGEEKHHPLNRIIAVVGGIVGGFMVAFSNTNWANSVEAEVYGLALAMSVALVWLALRYYETRGTRQSNRLLVFSMYLAMLGIGIHLTVFLVVPIIAIFFMLKSDATRREFLAICAFAIVELLLIILFANGSGAGIFKVVSVLLAGGLVVLLWRKISWGILVALATCGTVMMSFSLYFTALPIGIAILLLMGPISRKYGLNLDWKTGLAVVLAGFIGFSVHFFIPIRSGLNPRIDENNPSRDWTTFVRFLDRKQYGQTSMVDRMFDRRGTWENQFGRHPHMGYWSYFENQYSPAGLWFLPFFALGLVGMIVAIYKRLEIGLPFFTLFLLCSVGLILYMNFADGTQYNFRTGDAYLEVRDRDYFFTPAFVFFGIALGMGVSAVMMFIKDFVGRSGETARRSAVYASCLLVALPLIPLTQNYFRNDRSRNYFPYYYAKSLLDSCPENTILFTTGDNDTFPVWCLQEAYNYRKDIRVVNLSLLNTDWYVEQMKTRYDVPISLDIDQIRWYQVGVRQDGVEMWQPRKSFNDRPRKRMTYMQANQWGDQIIKVADMMVDEIVLENKFRDPIFFNAPPYASSPLQLTSRIVQVGQAIRLERDITDQRIDLERSHELFTDVYIWHGYNDPTIARDENATGVALGMGIAADKVHQSLIQTGDTARAIEFSEFMIEKFPEYWRPYLNLYAHYQVTNDTTAAADILQKFHDNMQQFHEANPDNYYYLQDYGMAKIELGRFTKSTPLVNEGVELMKGAFELNMNSSYTFQKYATALMAEGRFSELNEAIRSYSQYGYNQNDPFLRRLMSAGR